MGPKVYFHLGSSNSSAAETFEPDENDRDAILFVATDLGNQRVETTTIWQPRDQTGLVAQRASQLGRNEENGWEKSRRIVKRQLQRDSKNYSA